MLIKKLSVLAVGFCLGVIFVELHRSISWNSVVQELCRRNSEQEEISFSVPKVEERPFDVITPKWRLLCWILTSPQNHHIRAKYVKATWGRRCDKLLFMTTAEDRNLSDSTVALNVSEGRPYLWGKTKQALLHIYHNHLQEADFFLKADDDTYVIVENLKQLLNGYDPTQRLLIGCQLKHIGVDYMSGGAGYVLSKASLEALITEAMPNPAICRPDNEGPEDLELGRCLGNVNTTLVDALDERQRHKFFPLRVIDHSTPNRIREMKWDWFFAYIVHVPGNGTDCCSNYPISFHYMAGPELIELDFLIYHVKVFKIQDKEEEGNYIL